MKIEERKLSPEEIAAFAAHLCLEERAEGTIEKYLRDVGALAAWLAGEAVTKERTLAWKEHLLASGYAPRTLNSMLTAVNHFLAFSGRPECRVKTLWLQRAMFRRAEQALCQEEYDRLISTAERAGKERLALLIEAICATGIRVSEVQYLTVEAARNRRTDISLKGKVRTILLPGKLCRKLLKYAKHEKIASGQIFLTRGGKGLSRRQIWAEMKGLCTQAGVSPGKVFPHNLRHLFATTFYKVCRDIVKLADVLGHSSVETTRIYLLTTGEDHRKTLESLRLVS